LNFHRLRAFNAASGVRRGLAQPIAAIHPGLVGIECDAPSSSKVALS